MMERIKANKIFTKFDSFIQLFPSRMCFSWRHCSSPATVISANIAAIETTHPWPWWIRVHWRMNNFFRFLSCHGLNPLPRFNLYTKPRREFIKKSPRLDSVAIYELVVVISSLFALFLHFFLKIEFAKL